MTVAPTLETPAAAGAARRAGPRPVLRSAAPWLRLAALLLVAALTELVYVGFWPVSYYLSQGPEFTFEYLSQYPAVWERLLPLLARLEAVAPEAPRSVELLVGLLVRLFVGAFGLYLVAFFLTAAGLPRGWGAVTVLAPALAFQATLFLMPGLFTTDLFSYVMYGQIAGPYELNPYIHLPAYFPENRVMHWIHPVWHYAPSIYGPAWIDISYVLANRAAEWSDVDKVLAYKLLINLAHLGGVGFLALAVHRLRPGQVLPSVLLFAWNPLILFEYGGNGHNDAVMVSIMLLAVALFALQQRLLGLVALTVSFLIKMSSVLLGPYYVIAWASERGTVRGFLPVGLVAGVTVLLVVAGLYWPWWVGIETIGPILTWTQGPMFLNSPPDSLARWLASEHLMDPVAPDPEAALADARARVKLVIRILFAAYCAWELLRARGGLGLAAAGARVMLAFLLFVNTWVLPWYFTWPLALAIVVGWRSVTAAVLLGFSLSAPTAMYFRHFWHPYVTDWSYLTYLAPLAIAPAVWLARGVAGARAATDVAISGPSNDPTGLPDRRTASVVDAEA
jgi:hypothetical protein